MIATIQSIHLGDYHGLVHRYGCTVADESSIEFIGDISFSSDEWDVHPLLYKYNEFGFGLLCDTMRRFGTGHDQCMRLRQDTYDKMIFSVAKFLKSNLHDILNEYMRVYHERRTSYLTCIADLVIPYNGRKRMATDRDRAIRKRLSECGVDRIVYSDHIDFSHIINTPILVS